MALLYCIVLLHSVHVSLSRLFPLLHQKRTIRLSVDPAAPRLYNVTQSVAVRAPTMCYPPPPTPIYLLPFPPPSPVAPPRYGLCTVGSANTSSFDTYDSWATKYFRSPSEADAAYVYGNCAVGVSLQEQSRCSLLANTRLECFLACDLAGWSH